VRVLTLAVRGDTQRLLLTNIKNMEGFVGRIQNVVAARATQVQGYQEQLSQGTPGRAHHHRGSLSLSLSLAPNAHVT
jgi:hypothetical protein